MLAAAHFSGPACGSGKAATESRAPIVRRTRSRRRTPCHAAVMTPPQALVVGASSAIGRAIATEVARLGHAVTLWGRRRAALAEVAADCGALGVASKLDVVDVTDGDQL